MHTDFGCLLRPALALIFFYTPFAKKPNGGPCLLLVIVVCGLFALPACRALSTPDSAKHPMLYYGPEDVGSLQRKAKSTHAKIAAILNEAAGCLKDKPNDFLPPQSAEEFSSHWNEVYGNNLCAFAMYCVLNPRDVKARDLVLTFMDRMASYPDWYVASSRGKDEVPVGHSLSAFATAFDFLYEHFDEARRATYIRKICSTAMLLHKIVVKKSAGWTKQFIHNHAPTNNLAMLLGAIVCEQHDAVSQDAATWKKAAIMSFEKAMVLLNFVTDGTSDEGVAYGSYSSRGWTQYVFLAKRHLKIDHSNHPWFHKHFWFFYGTVFSGFQQTVGIGDSNHNWFYGPESQLVFLDAFFMKNGYGNWLADRIRENRQDKPPFVPSAAQRWSTIHTEFLFYDASIVPVEPVPPSGSKMLIYDDWGVVTYGGSRTADKTFLSMKSGAVHGEAISEIASKNLLKSLVRGWRNFNAGHEHPDQNSFVFAPNGRSFVTEALYSVKQTYLNNALQFFPFAGAKCHAPWVGQVGECSKWLSYANFPAGRGRIVSAALSDGMLHIAGEASGAYSLELGLKSVQRSMVLLKEDVLVVLDSIYLKPGSKLTKSSAFFHNILYPFEAFEHRGRQGAQITYPEGPYAFFWFHPDGRSPPASLQEESLQCESKPRTTHYVNVTFALNPNGVTRLAYVFAGPNAKIGSSYFANGSDADVVQIIVHVDHFAHSISLASLTSSLKARMEKLGFGGHARVDTSSGSVLLGRNSGPLTVDRCDVKDDDRMRFTQALISSKNFAQMPLNTVFFKAYIPADRPGFSTIVFICLFLLFLIYSTRRKQIGANYYKRFWSVLLTMLAGWSLFAYTFLISSPSLPPPRLSFEQECLIPHPSEEIYPVQPPGVFIASLPGSGAALLGELFEDSDDFLYLTSNEARIPTPGYETDRLDPCYWSAVASEVRSQSAEWFSQLAADPRAFMERLDSDTPVAERAVLKYQHLENDFTFVLNLHTGFWNTKLAWLHGLSPDTSRFIVVVRDPRDWIYALTRDDLTKTRKQRQEKTLADILASPLSDCPSPLDFLPWEYKQLRDYENGSNIERLAMQWFASVATMLRTGRSLQIVRYEDLVADPEFASKAIMERLGTTASLPQINRLTRAVRSGYKSFTFEPPVREHSTNNWKNHLPNEHVRTIERICGNVMKDLMYL